MKSKLLRTLSITFVLLWYIALLYPPGEVTETTRSGYNSSHVQIERRYYHDWLWNNDSEISTANRSIKSRIVIERWIPMLIAIGIPAAIISYFAWRSSNK